MKTFLAIFLGMNLFVSVCSAENGETQSSKTYSDEYVRSLYIRINNDRALSFAGRGETATESFKRRQYVREALKVNCGASQNLVDRFAGGTEAEDIELLAFLMKWGAAFSKIDDAKWAQDENRLAAAYRTLWDLEAQAPRRSKFQDIRFFGAAFELIYKQCEGKQELLQPIFIKILAGVFDSDS